MEQSIEQVLQQHEAQVINDIVDRRDNGKTVGWHCRVKSSLDYDATIAAVQQVIDKNKIPYNITESYGVYSVDFFVMINQ